MSDLVIAAVGDILVDRPDPTEALRELEPLFAAADITFGNFEGVLTDKNPPAPGSAHSTVVPTSNAAGLGALDVVSLANNHSMDAGYGGVEDTIAAFAAHGAACVGVGRSVDEAWEPVIVERGSKSVAFLAFTSVLRVGTEARAGLPGLAAIRAQDHYAPRHPGDYGPGVPPKIVSVVNEDDWQRATAAVASARQRADFVVVSAHWGDYSRPWVLTDHERSCADGLVTAGADLILGHHHHFYRGVEIRGTSPVFYGLGHVLFDHPRFAEELRLFGAGVDGLSDADLVRRFGEYGIYPRAESPTFPFHPMARNTGVALVKIGPNNDVTGTGIVPCLIDAGGTPHPVRKSDSEWDGVVSFLAETVTRPGLPALQEEAAWTHAGFDVVGFAPK